ncbi:serine--tRNA ligase [Desulfovibrio litoralis]|uniref:Serine--tRNA ligase n=1 Tax=Desulfovibrio litoralis DSM 11393 TaxID=1121455 RepID=A0A1M7SSA6_9BACT|nr:serine--tRNA ligase [Desulfovibrio litoralis]SHN61369.1 seryl-tRNA synthetase [Desulfovibrio litoralis DSM 11393]
MLDLKLLQKNLDQVAKALSARNSNINLNEFIELDEKRKTLLKEVELLKAERNQISSEVAKLKKSGQETIEQMAGSPWNDRNDLAPRLKKPGQDASELMEKSIKLGERIKELDQETEAVKQNLNNFLLNIPNIPDASVPFGKSEEDNPELHKFGTIKNFDFTPKEHWELGQNLNGLDFDLAGKLTGSRFTVYKGWAARLERALVNFFLDVQTTEHGYLEVIPPFMVNRKTMTGTGQLPKFEEDLFKLENWDYFLIPTAEVPLTNMFADDFIEENKLPMGVTAATPCFRSEAGSYGKDTKGLIRQHQFTKVEMVRFAHPDDSFNQLEKMREHAETLLQRLELPYRVITLCTGDMGFSSAKTYDLEVWLPGQNKYREISSCSNCTDFQARRANIKFKPNGGKAEYVHTLNGSGLAVGRTLVAVLENGQQKDGSIKLPKALVPYMGGLEHITA